MPGRKGPHFEGGDGVANLPVHRDDASGFLILFSFIEMYIRAGASAELPNPKVA